MIPLALAFLMQGPAQQPKTTSLATYLLAHPWDSTKDGPLVVVDPGHKLTNKEPKDLDAFDRKVLRIGSLSAIVPKTMVVIDDSLTEPPNMYDGLPEEAKVLYLLRSLSEEQWKTLNDSGIGLNDLEGEQKLVFKSLLPKPFAWSTYLADQNGLYGKQQAGATLTDDELLTVRLKVQRYVALQVNLSGGNSYSTIGAENFRALPGDPFSIHDYDARPVESSFGVKFRSVVDNQPKDSNLDYAGLKARVKIPANLTLREVLPFVGSAVHRELFADVHIAERPVSVVGGEVAAGDLLKALAACVTGTYRRVGGAYVLTSDITGTGNRQFRVALWEDALRRKVSNQSDTWRHEIAKTAGFQALTFGGGPLMMPSKELADTLDKGDNPIAQKVTTDKLGPGISKLLDLWDAQYKSQPIRKDQVGISTNVSYSFVLPDGNQLQPENQTLGPRWLFTTTYSPRLPNAPPNVPFALPANFTLQIAVRADKPEQLPRFIQSAAAHGAKRVWLESIDTQTVTRAIELASVAHIEVGLLVFPWQLPAGDTEVDLTIFGDHGATVTQRTLESTAWTQWLEGQKRPPPAFRDSMSPSDPLVSERWKKIAALSQLPGVSGVILANTQPPGYEPKRADWHSSLGPLEWGVVGHGFSESQRLEFLRVNFEDPIDLVDPEIYSTADLEQPFFPEGLGRGMGEATLLSRWRELVAAKNNKQIVNLGAALGRPTWIEMRPELVNSQPNGYGVFAKWEHGKELPMGREHQSNMFEPGSDGIVSFPWPLETASPIASERGQWLLAISKGQNPELAKIGVIIDFTQASIGDVGSALDRWFALPAK